MEIFLIKSIIGGILLAIAIGPLGCITVWKRISYFGDSLAHASLLGVVLSIILHIPMVIGIMIICILFSIMIIILNQKIKFNLDIILSIIAPFCLSLSLILSSKIGSRIDLNSFLFGDILSINISDIYKVSILLLILSIWLYYNWNKIIVIILNEDIAIAENLNIQKIYLEYILLLAFIISVGIKMVGALLITSMLILPAATSRRFSSSPTKMAMFSIFIGIINICGGMYLSFHYDFQTSPMIVIFGGIIFVTSLIKKPVN